MNAIKMAPMYYYSCQLRFLEIVRKRFPTAYFCKCIGKQIKQKSMSLKLQI